MKSTKNHDTFYNIIEQYTDNPMVIEMDYSTHHTSSITCFDHSILVAYICYILAPKFRCNIHSSVKAGLLHDLYLSYREDSNISLWKHLSVHPDKAIENAACFNLSESEKNMIKKHMWPINISLIPNTKEEVLINVADKISTIIEISGLYWVLRFINKLRALKPKFTNAFVN